MSSDTVNPTPTADEGAVRGVLRELYAAWAANDAEAFAALYTEEATVVMPGVFNRGRDAVRAYIAAGFAGPLRGSRAGDEPLAIQFLGDDAAVVVSAGSILMAGETEVPAGRQVRATWVLARRDGRWRIAAYQNCPMN